MTTPGVWGPECKTAAVAITFDHVGEASDLQSGALPPDSPVGNHPSVGRDLPRILSVLADSGLAATFYIEAWNCSVYPEAMRHIEGAGHSLGWHGWWNEPSYRATPEELADSLDKTLAAYDSIGLRPRGARPPGGLLGPHALDVFVDAGFEFVSLAGERYGLQGGTPVLPYAWRNIDGCYYLPQFSGLRVPPGTEAVDSQELLRSHLEHLETVIAQGGFTSFIFHVPWTDTQAKVDIIRELIHRLQADDRVWLAPSEQIARWMSSHPADFPDITHVDAPPAW